MSRRFGGGRSPDAWSSPHDRARVRLAERMTEPLEPEESAWLDAHLVGCESCREIDATYQSDRAYLRAMRVVPPPRDLWARTSAALDVEQGRAGGGRRSRPARRRSGSGSSLLAFPGGRWAPAGALGSIAAVMVVGFLVGNALIGGGPAGSPSHGVALGSSATPNPVPTPNVIPGSDVAWVSTDSDGSIVLKQAQVNDVCPPDKPTSCTPFDTHASNVVTLSVKPKSVHQSPTSGQMIVFGVNQGGGSGLTMYVINTGKAPAPTPAVTPTTPPTTPPTMAPTVPPSASTGPSAPPSGGPSQSAGTSVPPSTTPASAPPTASIAPTPETTASPTPKATSTASIVPNVTPPPSAATLIAIASNVDVLNAETAAYSPDGAWFAFTARPHEASSGSDIYLWHAGDAQAKRVTKDLRAVFSGWLGNQLIGSQAAPPVSDDPAAPTPDPLALGAREVGVVSFIVDPTSFARTPIPTAAWRPAVDPTGKFVVYWEGTVALDPTSGGWRTATGRLVIRSWPIVAGTAPVPSAAPTEAPASAEPSTVASPSASASAGSSALASPSASPKATRKPTASPIASASPSASVAPSPSSSPSVPDSPTPSPSAPSGLPSSIASASDVDWAVAWDESGTHLALWIGDSGDRSFGRLSLLTIGPNGLPTANGAVVSARPALPGFALSDGHLAWATPPGVNAEGSQLKVVAYGPDGGETSGAGQPGVDTVIVVQH